VGLRLCSFSRCFILLAELRRNAAAFACIACRSLLILVRVLLFTFLFLVSGCVTLLVLLLELFERAVTKLLVLLLLLLLVLTRLCDWGL